MENRIIAENKKENKARKTALIVIGIMTVIWTVLGVLSFTDREGYDRPMTRDVLFADQNALKGKQVFQAYNCMDCHTIVGNGAYFAPDLTNSYKDNGPAWLLAYLGSPGTYPTEAIVNIQLKHLINDGEIDMDSLEEYYAQYPAAETRVKERGGIAALMPNLQFSKDEINALIAFFKYTALINTAGWPPEVKAKSSVIEAKKRELEEKSGIYRYASPTASAADGAASEEGRTTSGESIAHDLGCIACHSTDGSTRIGPSWKNLFDSEVKLADGRTVVADEAYLRLAILEPNEHLVEGYNPGLMPSYQGVISDEDIDRIIDFIKTIK